MIILKGKVVRVTRDTHACPKRDLSLNQSMFDQKLLRSWETGQLLAVDVTIWNGLSVVDTIGNCYVRRENFAKEIDDIVMDYFGQDYQDLPVIVDYGLL